MAENLKDKELLDNQSPETSESDNGHSQNNELGAEQTSKNPTEQLNSAREAVTKAEQDSVKENDVASKLEGLKKEEPAETDFRVPFNKKKAFQESMQHIQRNLGKVDKAGSKVIHQSVIRSLSEVSSKSLTRPSGLLGGGIMALLGTSAYLFYTKHIGLRYNYSIFLFLLIGGFIVGLVIEALIRLFRGRKAT